ncbi:uncharacterized protein isoform X2 [Choristoneura fumiferana]|uniref:uncharacterized protein isoform X2 n=1 Tax=Choristoneura fumiferana TaxID=7141 RepID=UPI003D156958
MNKYSTYGNKGVKPCISLPTCSVHKHKPRGPPCPQPDKCFQKCKKRKVKCASAVETVNPYVGPCDCLKEQSKCSRLAAKRSNKTHRKRIQKAYKTRSMESRWKKQKGGGSGGGGGCCVIL